MSYKALLQCDIIKIINYQRERERERERELHSVAFCFFVNLMLVVMCSIFRRRDYKNLIWGSVLDGSFQPKG